MSLTIVRVTDLRISSRAWKRRIVTCDLRSAVLSALISATFLAASQSWLAVFACVSSMAVSSRRIVTANWARNWSSWARRSITDRGRLAHKRRTVRRTARSWISGASIAINRQAVRKPMPISMIG
jgi:hypothetical protein